MVVKQLDVLEMPKNEQVQLVEELRGKLQQKITEARLQQSSSEVDNIIVNAERACRRNQQSSRFYLRNNMKTEFYLYLFTSLRWCLR